MAPTIRRSTRPLFYLWQKWSQGNKIPKEYCHEASTEAQANSTSMELEKSEAKQQDPQVLFQAVAGCTEISTTTTSEGDEELSGVQNSAGDQTVSSSVPPSQRKMGAAAFSATQNKPKKGGTFSSVPPNLRRLQRLLKG